MAWIGSITDRSMARKSAGSALFGQNVFSVVVGNLTSVATAQAAVATNALALSVCDRHLATPISRGYQIASNLGATFGSTYAAFYASLPDSAGYQRNMIQG